MSKIDQLVEIYNKWGHANGISPLPSADDLIFDGRCGRKKISNNQIKWLKRFSRVWNRVEDHEYRMSRSEEDKCMMLWHDYMEWDKRGFQEFFIEEFGFSINDDITYKQLKLLCEVLIPHAKTYYHPKRSK